MPPKDNLKYLSKMNKTELKRVAKHESIDITGLYITGIRNAIKKEKSSFSKVI